MWRRLALVGALAPLILAGCGSGTKDLTKDRTPDQILTDAQGAATHETQFAFTVNGSSQGTVAKSARTPSVVIQSLASGIRANGQGTVNDGDASVDFDATMAQLPSFQGNVTKVGGKLFVGILGTDYRLGLPEEQVSMVRPSLLPSGLLTWVSKPRIEGREALDGIETVRMTGQVDLDVVSRDTVNALASLESSPVSSTEIRRAIPEVRRALTERSVRMWIGTADLLPRRVVVKLRFQGHVTAFPELSKGSLDVDIRFSDYGKAVTISAPQTNRVLTPNSARSLLG